jgi:parallel beta-helix repeat protein
MGINLDASTGGSSITGNVISHCLVQDAGAEGIQLIFTFAGSVCDGNVVRDCTVRKATGRGIYVGNATYCRIEDNHVSQVASSGGTAYGLYVAGSNNLVIRNSCNGSTDNIFIGPNNTHGPEVNVTGALSSTGSASHPMANYNMR